MQQAPVPQQQAPIPVQATPLPPGAPPGSYTNEHGQLVIPIQQVLSYPLNSTSRIFFQAPMQRQPEAVFVPPPDSQRVRRVLHSEVYLKYIERMYNDELDEGDRAHVSNWRTSSLPARPVPGAPTPVNCTDWIR